MPNIGSIVSGSIQTPTTMMRAAGGAAVMILSITPGTPTHSKIAAGRSGGPGSHGGGGGADPGTGHAGASLQLPHGPRPAGEATPSAPARAAGTPPRLGGVGAAVRPPGLQPGAAAHPTA